MLRIPDHYKQGPLALRAALDVFDQLADMEDISFGFYARGCEARAHIMCRRLMDAGLEAGKASARSHSGRLRISQVNDLPYGSGYHVAASLMVEMPDGSVQSLVFDPGLFDGPVTLREWGEKIGADPELLEIAGFGVCPAGCLGDYKPTQKTDGSTDRECAQTMRLDLLSQKPGPRILHASRLRRDLVAQSAELHPLGTQAEAAFSQAGRPALRGRTWISETLWREEKRALELRAGEAYPINPDPALT